MINSFVSPHLSDVDQLKRFLPQPQGMEHEDGLWVVKAEIAAQLLYKFDLALSDLIIETWLDLYKKLVENLAYFLLGQHDYFAVKLRPQIWTNYDRDSLNLALYADIFVVPEKNYFIPIISYTNEPVPRAIEWRCGYCSSPNKMKERHCTQCGAARALLIQEM